MRNMNDYEHKHDIIWFRNSLRHVFRLLTEWLMGCVRAISTACETFVYPVRQTVVELSEIGK